MKKKIVWLPYDFDTALGINNEGELVFGYRLEDTDHLDGGADVYNGQESVIWNNIRLAFADELKEMYQTLRSQGKLSYEAIEKAFEDHQSKWPEALFNEDSQFCYLDPLINEGTNYLAMLQGSKEEQRKWWMYNRFRYIDSKYNAGDALSDLIQLRSYAKSDITITPYADIYPTVKFGSYLVSSRGTRNVATTLVCPVSTLNDTETYIYSASQLASVGDLSGLKVGFADFSMATKLQSLKLGDSSISYENQNLKTLTLGNNVLLQTIDVRNCTALGSGDMKVVDISGCTGIQKAWFTGTQISALTLPIGGVLNELALPGTITNLTIRNQPRLATFSFDGNTYENISTCRIENVPYFLADETRFSRFITELPNNARVRFVGLDIDWLSDTDEISDFYDSLDRFRGLDISGGNLDDAYVEGVIHINSAKGSDIAALLARYPYMRIDALHTESTLYYYNGETLITSETVLDGGDGSYSGTTPTKANSSDGHYSYTFAGWSKDTDDNTVDADALQSIVADRNVYACFTSTVRTYTVYWQNNGSTIETDSNVPWGTVPHYDGATPTKDGQTSTGWLPDATVPITGDVTFVAQYLPVYTVTFKNDTGTTTLDTQNVVQGQDATYGGTTPTSSEDASLAWLGWATSANAHTANAVLTNVQSDMTVYAAFESAVEVAEITDSWDTIIANIDNSTYSTKYKVGNYKPLDLGTEGTINMQIVAMDADELASGGYAPLTFIGMELLNTQAALGGSADNVNFTNSDIRVYLNSTIYNLLPTNIKARVNRVNKVTKSYFNGTQNRNYIGTELLWLPSDAEIFGRSRFNESTGIMYTTLYTDNASRIKKRLGTANNWATRSAYNNNYFQGVHANGYDTLLSPGTFMYSVCLGFCLGLEPETIEDSWSTILANTNPSASYSIGDTKMIDLGTEGKHLMEIVAFDEDDKADGSGKAKITWISKDLLNTTHRMNPANDNGAIGTGGNGGWENCEMRTYLKNTIKPLIPETIRNAIVNVTKIQSTVTDGTMIKDGQTTTDDVWIPSNHEVLSTNTTYESTGATYSSKFSSNTNRTKKRNDSVNGWWTRSALSTARFRAVYTLGNVSYYSADTANGVALGFCTDVVSSGE